MVGKTNSPVMGFRGVMRQLPLRSDLQSVRHHEATPAARRVAARRPWPTGWCRSPRAPTAADRSASRRRGAASTGTSRRSAVCRVVRPDASRARIRSSSRARSRGRSRTPRSCSTRSPATTRATPTRSTRRRLRRRAAPLDPRQAHRLQPRLRRLPGRPAHRDGRGARRCDAFKEAGAHVEEVELGITRDQRELSDLWCRLIMPLTSRPSSASRPPASICCGDHRDDFPPEYLDWVDEGYEMTCSTRSRPGDAHGGVRCGPGRASTTTTCS